MANFYDPTDPFSDIGTAQRYAEQGVRGYGQAALPGLQRTIGTTLGGLNAMGALRSGGTVAALNNIATDYGNQIGAYADQANANAMEAGLNANRQRLAWNQNQFDQDQARRYWNLLQSASINRTIGGVLGAGVGFITGGPLGAAGSLANSFSNAGRLPGSSGNGGQ